MPRWICRCSAIWSRLGGIALVALFGSLPLSAPRAQLNTNSCNQFTQVDTAISICTSWIAGQDAGNPAKLYYDYYFRGWAWARKKDFSKAIADYDQALKLRPSSPNTEADVGSSFVYKLRAEARTAKGDRLKAIADYDQAIRFGTGSFEYHSYHVSRGELFLKAGNVDRAIADLSAGLGIQTGGGAYYHSRATAYMLRGDAYEKKGDHDHARADFQAAVALKLPDTPQDYDRKAQADARKKLAAAAAPAPAVSPAPVVVPAAVPPPVVAALPTATLDPGRRIALVIGNSAYKAVAALPNPRRDAATVAEALRRAGFQTVTQADDLTREKLVDALRLFAAEAEKADWALVYYAGHGIEIGGVNYLIPVDAKLAADRDVQFEAVPLEQVLGAAEAAKKFRLVLLDACRDNPFAAQMRRTVATRSIGRGLAQIEPDSGTLVVYAAKHGQTALDGDAGNSPFASAFVRRLATPGLEIRKLFDLVRDDVMSATSRRQQPFSYGSVPGSEDFYFVAKQ